MQVMCEREVPRQRDGRVEIDYSYLGGELSGGKRGCGSENKVWHCRCADDGREAPAADVPEKFEFTKEAIAEWAKMAMAASARVMSDGLWCFRAVTAVGAAHERTATDGGQNGVKLE